MKKDARVSARINSTILDLIKVKGMSIQKIIDEYVRNNFSEEVSYTCKSYISEGQDKAASLDDESSE